MNSGTMDSRATSASAGALRRDDPLRHLVAWLPQPVRFLAVGAMGLVTDLGVFTLLIAAFERPLMMRLASLAVATLVTWRLNRALTFDQSGRHQGAEALRYAAVTVVAQGLSYGIFAALVLTALARHPQVALVTGAAIAAVFSYCGHRFFAFAPVSAPAAPPVPQHRRETVAP